MESRKRQHRDLFYPDTKKRKKTNIYPPIYQNQPVFPPVVWNTQNVTPINIHTPVHTSSNNPVHIEFKQMQELVKKMEIQLVYQNNQIEKLQKQIKTIEEKHSCRKEHNKKVKFKSNNYIGNDLEECIFKMDLDEYTNQNSDNNISKKNKIELEEWSYIS
jgi:predicted GNAT family acetyltransferase